MRLLDRLPAPLLATLATLLLPSVDGFYLPGVAPTTYSEGQQVPLFVNRLTPSVSADSSVRSVFSFDYYTEPLHFCRPEKIEYQSESLGSIIFGDRIQSSSIELRMRQDVTCMPIPACGPQTFTANEAKFVNKRIKEAFNINWLVDGLPAGEQVVDTSNGDSWYTPGFSLGYTRNEQPVFNNHYDIFIDYHQPMRGQYRVVGVEVHPNSDRDSKDLGGGKGECSNTGGARPDLILKEDGDTNDVVFTYSVIWRESPTSFATRWDRYLHVYDPQIHWFSLINAALIVIFLSSTVFVILVRTLRRDITRYNKLDAFVLNDLADSNGHARTGSNILSDPEDSVQEDSGWKLVHGDVFRPPRHPLFLSVLVGNGAQLFMMTGFTIVFALLGFLSPSNRGALGSVMILLYTLFGSIGGFVSSYMYKNLLLGSADEWLRNMLLTPVVLPAFVFGMFFLLDLFLWAKASSGAVPVTTMLVLIGIWFLVSVPLSLLGSWFAFKRASAKPPTRVNQIPRQIPDPRTSLSTHSSLGVWLARPIPAVLLCGLPPFIAIFSELFFIFSSLWSVKLYYMFGFLFVSFGLAIVTCATSSILGVYYQLSAENYHWQWRSFGMGAATGVYVFVNAVVFWASRLKLGGLVASVVYLGYSVLIAVGVGVLGVVNISFSALQAREDILTRQMAPKGKKKKPSNPARGVATTSVPSKPKPTETQDDSSPIAKSETAGKANEEKSSATLPSDGLAGPNVDNVEANAKEMHELSPEELEERLVDAELQHFVEQYSGKVSRDSSRQVNELETDCRLKRSQAQGLQCQYVLPERKLSMLLQLTCENLECGRHHFEFSTAGPMKQSGDLVAKLWTLQKTLKELSFGPELIEQAIKHVLRYPPSVDSDGRIWGLDYSTEWLAIMSAEQDLPVFDSRTGKPKDVAGRSKDTGDEDLDEQSDSPTTSDDFMQTMKAGPDTDVAASLPPEQDFEVSDLEDGLEPDELQPAYLSTRTRLFELEPELEQSRAGGKRKKGRTGQSTPCPAQGPGAKKLQNKLQKIESDPLFDKTSADAQWENQRILLARDQAERRRLQVEEIASPPKSDADAAMNQAKQHFNPNSSESASVEEPNGTQESDDDQALADLFGATAFGDADDNVAAKADTNGTTNVSIRDFGNPGGVDPRRVLEDACRARDGDTQFTYKLISSTAFSNRHRLQIRWSKSKEWSESLKYHAVETDMRPRVSTFTMQHIATPDANQSTSFMAVFALYQISVATGKEDKSYLRLATAWKDLWGELAGAYKRQVENAEKDCVRHIKAVIDAQNEDDSSDDVVLRKNFKQRAGANAPSNAHTQRPTQISSSADLVELWVQKCNNPSYKQMLQGRQNLPMWQFKDEMMKTIDQHQITIIRGETGCGKSTQLPAFILEHELSQGKSCKRVSQELGEDKRDLGTSRSLVGYAIRLESQTADSTRLVYATTGIVLRMLESRAGFADVTHIVVDEVHERSIETDFLLIILHKLLQSRPELRVILMSATVDADKFSKYFYRAPVLNVPGRTFPVNRKFLEDAIELTGHAGTVEDFEQGTDEDAGSDSQDQRPSNDGRKYLANYSSKTRQTLSKWNEYRIDYDLVLKLITKIASHADYKAYSQAILVFLPGLAEIRAMHSVLSGSDLAKRFYVHMLHSSIASEDQQAAFAPPPRGQGKIILSTNIAETGITIPDITSVIDTGTHKEMRYDERRQISRLVESFISRANAKQRCGRAGRVQEGLCFHLFTRQRHDERMAEEQTPEMLRLSLQDLIMRVKVCRLGDIQETLSQALDPPSAKNIQRAIDSLKDVDALTKSEDLTPLGQHLAKLPLDPYLGKLTLYGAVFSCLDVTLTLAAMLTSRSPFVTSPHMRKQTDLARAAFKKHDSDLLTEYNAYTAWRRTCTEGTMAETQFCRKNSLSPQSLATIEDIKAQLLTALEDTNLVALSPSERHELSRVANTNLAPGRKRRFVPVLSDYNAQNANPMLVTAVISWSFYPKLLVRDGKGWRNVGSNQSIYLHPTSMLRLSPPPHAERIKYLSFYSILQSGGARHFNAHSLTPVSPLMLALGVGSVIWYPTAFVLGIDGGKLRFGVDTPPPKRKANIGVETNGHDARANIDVADAGKGEEPEAMRDVNAIIGPWKTFTVLKLLRRRLDEIQARKWKRPGEALPLFLQRWMDCFLEMTEEMGGSS
ncbi:MAG: hypothetical protein Q9159_004153 [Coniocarpon cinnabarinum]